MAEAVHAIYFVLAVWMILSGLDDLWIDLAYLFTRLRPTRPPSEDLAQLPEARIALWIPAWREDAVIAGMLTHNAASIRYSNYHIFCGTYPNDEATLDVLRSLEDKHSTLHISLAPHNGPTSKADNMNWIYQNMCLVEERLGQPFDIVVIHDSEDLIHPEEFRWLNQYTKNHDFVQIPVLALPTPWWHFTHGIYCDEFAETQQKDLPTRNRLNGFSPSCGVGTGYRRDALARLAESEENRLFEPDSLTEDYMNGLRMHRLGMRQIYLPVFWRQGQPIATREYFPQRFHAAVRQRSRWVTGIALQTWQKVGWSKSLAENYWFFRDRKGLLGNPLSLLANFLFVLCAAGLAPKPHSELLPIASLGIVLQFNRMLFRMHFSGRVYGLFHALSVPLRVPYCNLVNTLATLSALHRYIRARIRKETLVWLKTEHQYPNRAALTGYSRRLGEVLMDRGILTAQQIEDAVAAKPKNLRLGEFLVAENRCTWNDVYAALSLLSGYPLEDFSPASIDPEATRSLPRALCEEAYLQPVAFQESGLAIATSEPPTQETLDTIERFSPRGASIFLVTPPELQRLKRAAETRPLARVA
jgi:bacteriophage N4 adsorption protein B